MIKRCDKNYYSKGKTNILIDGDIIKTYAALVTAVGFNKDDTGPNNDGNGSGTYHSNLKSGLKSYLQSRSYSLSIIDYVFNLWINFKSSYDLGNCNIIFIEGNHLNREGEWEQVGHFVVGVGYRIMNDGTRYIRVYDGWNNSNSRFIHFDSDSLTQFKGSSMVVS